MANLLEQAGANSTGRSSPSRSALAAREGISLRIHP